MLQLTSEIKMDPNTETAPSFLVEKFPSDYNTHDEETDKKEAKKNVAPTEK
jgi:hypothetical protein